MNDMTQRSCPRSSTRSLVAVCALILLTSCSSFEYDLASVPFEVSAKPAASSSGSFRIEKKSILWAHGLFGESNPDVAALVSAAGKDHQRIAGFRVRVSAGFHDWLITHLTLTLMRMKTVVIEGQLVK